MPTVDVQPLHALRQQGWRQTPQTRIPDPAAATTLIEQVGIATLYPASPEIPNLLHAFTGDPTYVPGSAWDSPSGHVYGWRWDLGRVEAAFYTAIVRQRPTWVSWPLLPAVLRLRGEPRAPDELYHRGELSENAYRIAQALEASGGVLSTGELRRQAGFPTGKAQRAAYLKAVEELDTRLLLAKVFAPDDTDMRHALVAYRYPEAVAAAEALLYEDALDAFLTIYLPHAVYAAPALLARHMKLAEPKLRAGLDRMAATGAAEAITINGVKGECYVWAAALS